MPEQLLVFLRARLDDDEQAARGARRSTATSDEPDGYATWRADDSGEGVYAAHGNIARDAFGYMADELAAHIARHDPARVLREVEAKRRILDRHTPLETNAITGPGMRVGRVTVCDHDRKPWPCPDVLDLAAPYADHPECREDGDGR